MSKKNLFPYSGSSQLDWVKETAIGKKFIASDIWLHYVLTKAVNDFASILQNGKPRNRVLGVCLDLGCGQGLALPALHRAFSPDSIIGFDIDGELLQKAQQCHAAIQEHYGAQWVRGNAGSLPFVTNSIGMIFCHQVLHHVNEQRVVLQECYRVLAPGGIMMSGESCVSFIDGRWWVQAFFRHPKGVQKNASEYIDLIKSVGFQVDASEVKCSRPWWSRRFLGLTQFVGLNRRAEPSELLCIARKSM